MTDPTLAIASLLAILLSPLVAVLVSTYLQNRKERRDHNLFLLGALIAIRHNPVGDETIRALNTIDVVFHDAPSVRKLWQDYFAMLNNQGLNNPMGRQQWQKKNLEMITEMAKVLGYGKAITALDVDRVYTPIALEERNEKNAALVDGFIRLLNAVNPPKRG